MKFELQELLSFVNITSNDLIQLGILLVGLVGIPIIIKQINQSQKLKQSDHFLYLSERYTALQAAFEAALLQTGLSDDISTASIVENYSLDEIPNGREAVYKAARELISLYKIEYELWRFGSIASFHWQMWQTNFQEEAKSKFWPNFWFSVRSRYYNNPKFQRFLDKAYNYRSTRK